jgi:hypothetical protein
MMQVIGLTANIPAQPLMSSAQSVFSASTNQIGTGSNYDAAGNQAVFGSFTLAYEAGVSRGSEKRAFGAILNDADLTRKILFVRCVREVCRIDLDRESFHVSPHVGRAAILAWVKGLEAIRQTKQQKQADQRLYDRVTGAKYSCS